MLPLVFWTEAAADSTSTHGIALLQLRERAVLAVMIRKLVVRKDAAGNDVGPHDDPYACAARAPSMWSVASLAASSGVLPRSRATM